MFQTNSEISSATEGLRPMHISPLLLKPTHLLGQQGLSFLGQAQSLSFLLRLGLYLKIKHREMPNFSVPPATQFSGLCINLAGQPYHLGPCLNSFTPRFNGGIFSHLHRTILHVSKTSDSMSFVCPRFILALARDTHPNSLLIRILTLPS